MRQVQANSLLPERVAEQLRAMVARGEMAPGAQLPNEPELSRAMNVSRSTLRAALDTLAREGVVVRRRGVGTFVADQPIAANNLNLNWGVTEVIRATGSTPGTTDLEVTRETADQRVAQHLGLPAGADLVVVERVRLADARRVVFSQDFFPAELFSRGGLSLDDVRQYLLAHQSLYGLLKEKLSLNIHHAMAWLRPVAATPALAQRLHTLVGSGLLYIEQVDYDTENRPLVLADEFHVADAFTFTVYRSQLGPG